MRVGAFQLAHELELEIEIARLVARGIRVRDIRRHKLLARAEQIHVSFQIGAGSV
jgi:hypothetical protein